MLTPRQELILRKVVESYVEAGQPVGSKTIAADPAIDFGPSTIRNELALLEESGLLAHPHTSAGRVPTDAGHRYVVDRMLSASRPARAPEFELSLVRRELDEAMRATTATLSQVTNLLAIVSAPAIESETVRHVEVLALQPQVVMVVIITSAGRVSKYVCTFESVVDPGLVAWAGEYFNERVVGQSLGARMLASRLNDPALSGTESSLLERLAPAFRELSPASEDTLYIDGTSRLLGTHRFSDASEINDLMELLERRVALLEVMRSALVERGVYVRIGSENALPALHSVSIVASGYGLAQRKLGAVSVIGPVRMDYARAISTVREAATQLSRFIEDVYDEG